MDEHPTVTAAGAARWTATGGRFVDNLSSNNTSVWVATGQSSAIRLLGLGARAMHALGRPGRRDLDPVPQYDRAEQQHNMIN